MLLETCMKFTEILLRCVLLVLTHLIEILLPVTANPKQEPKGQLTPQKSSRPAFLEQSGYAMKTPPTKRLLFFSLSYKQFHTPREMEVAY